MTKDEFPDAILREVSRLPVLMPNEQRAARLRARCHARLARETRKKNRPLAPALTAGFCLLYLSAVARDAWRLL